MIESLWEMVQRGGWPLMAIAVVSIIAWTLILWEWLRLHERTVAGWSGIEQAIDDLCRGRAIDRQAVERTGKNFIGELLSSDLLGRRFDRLSFKARIQPLLNGECVMFQRSPWFR